MPLPSYRTELLDRLRERDDKGKRTQADEMVYRTLSQSAAPSTLTSLNHELLSRVEGGPSQSCPWLREATATVVGESASGTKLRVPPSSASMLPVSMS
jgi:hypothetical protein